MNPAKSFLGLLTIFFVFVNFISCSCDCPEDEPIVEDPIEDPDPEDEAFSSNRPDQDPLNVVYFIPTDFKIAFESKESILRTNLSEAMLFAQAWFKKQMELGGVVDKSFALSTRNSNTEVRIITVLGEKASDQYANNMEVRTEIEAYFQEHPDDMEGEFTLVFSDDGTGIANRGGNKMAFIRSPDDFAMVDTGKTLDGLQLLTCQKFGTLLHELAHALNAPHVAHKASELPNLSLMGGGGSNRWDAGGKEDQVKLVASTVAIFDVCGAFNKNNLGIEYHAVGPNIDIVSYSIAKNNAEQQTQATITFTSDVAPLYLYVALDAEPNAANTNYDTVAFTTTVTPTGKTDQYEASLEMPYSEFFNGYDRYGIKTDNNIELSVNILTENGFRIIPLSYKFTISSANSPEPDDNINKESYALSDRSAWSITANTTSHGQPEAQGAPMMLDGDLSTFWFSDWPTPSASDTPHVIEVDMGGEHTYDGIYLYSLRTPNPQFRPKHIVVEVSSDNSTYITAGEHMEAISNPDTRVLFETSQTARFLRITIDEVHTTNGVENLIINELDMIVL